jgi:hypothetical protein
LQFDPATEVEHAQLEIGVIVRHHKFYVPSFVNKLGHLLLLSHL